MKGADQGVIVDFVAEVSHKAPAHQISDAGQRFAKAETAAMRCGGRAEQEEPPVVIIRPVCH